MSRYVAPNAASFSEFHGTLHGKPYNLNGDCGIVAIQMACHCYDPARFPLTEEGLGDLCDLIINQWKLAGSNGAMDLGQVSQALAKLGIPHTGINTDYSQPAGASFPAIRTALRQMFSDGANGKQLTLVGLETSRAHVGSDGVPDDEPGVYNHYHAYLGGDDKATTPDGHPGGYLRGDGDSRTDNQSGKPTPLILTSIQEIQSTMPWGAVLIPPFAAEKSTMWTNDATGATDEHGAHVGAGMAAYIDQHALQGTYSLIPAGEVYDAAGRGLVALSNGDVLTWHDNAVHDNEAAQIVAEQYAQLATLAEQVKTLDAEIAAAPALSEPTPAPAPEPETPQVFEVYRWQNGETLADVSKAVYGDASHDGLIATANDLPLDGPTRVNLVLIIPALPATIAA